MVETLIVTALIILITPLVLALYNDYLPKWFCHNLGWHLQPKKIGFDGASLQGVCPRCGQRVLQDSQGNWFSVENN